MKLVFASTLLLTIGCGGDPLEPGAGSETGTGTGTLLVTGSANAEPREGFWNVTHASDFDTDFRIRITLDAAQVKTGMVTVKSQLVDVPLTWTDSDGGMWVGRAAGYDEVYQLDIVSGTDEVHGVIVDGPDFHVFTAPLQGATVDSTQPLEVAWDREETADVATTRAPRIDRITIADTGNYTLSAGSLEANQSEPRENTITLRRGDHVTPAGAIGGSDFAVTIENDLMVIAQPNPAL